MKKELKKYLAEIGSRGGKASRRKITPEQQAAMQEARKAARLRKEQNARAMTPGANEEPLK
jgi:hypothetical protein